MVLSEIREEFKNLNHLLHLTEHERDDKVSNGGRQMNMKDFSKYLKYESFDEALHHARRISSERTAESESLIKVFQEGQNQKKAA